MLATQLLPVHVQDKVMPDGALDDTCALMLAQIEARCGSGACRALAHAASRLPPPPGGPDCDEAREAKNKKHIIEIPKKSLFFILSP
jgi:hypothetical protein